MNRRKFSLGMASALAMPAVLGTRGAWAQGKVRWSFIGIQPFTQPFLAEIKAGFERVSERTEGRFAMDFANVGETPHTAPQGLSVIRDGLADVMEWYPGYVTNTYPVLAGAELPFIMPEFGSIEDGVAAANRAWESPSVKASLEKVFADHGAVTGLRVIWEPINIWLNKQIESPVDLDGSAIRANTREMGDMVNATNGVAHFMSITDAYQAMQRNAVQGFSGASASIVAYKLHEVLKSGIITHGQFVSGTFLARKASVDALPADIREIYDEEMARTQARLNELSSESELSAREKAAELGLSIRHVTQEEYSKLRAIAEDKVWSAWKERVGADGDKVLAEVQAAISGA